MDTAYEEILPDKEINHWNNVCFFITPIGSDGSEQKKHANLFMEYLVVPAMKELGMKVVCSDTINADGMITSQIIDYLVNSALVIADLSFHDPNVFYELSLRHTLGKPVIHLIRNCDSFPFDIHGFRTIEIDDNDLYTFVSKLESYKANITAYAHQSINDTNAGPINNLITTFFKRRGGNSRLFNIRDESP